MLFRECLFISVVDTVLLFIFIAGVTKGRGMCIILSAGGGGGGGGGGEARRSSAVRAFAYMMRWMRRIDPSWGAPIEPFLVPASAPRLV